MIHNNLFEEQTDNSIRRKKEKEPKLVPTGQVS